MKFAIYQPIDPSTVSATFKQTLCGQDRTFGVTFSSKAIDLDFRKTDS